MGSGKHRWKFSFHRSAILNNRTPKEFICPISGSLMADPVIVASGHTFERNCVQACNSLGFQPVLPDGSTPDFSTIIPNLALKSAIFNWCNTNSTNPLKPLDSQSAINLVRTFQQSQNTIKSQHHNQENPFKCERVTDRTEPNRQPISLSSSSQESVTTANVPTIPFPLTNRPSSDSSCSSSSDIETLNTKSAEEDELLTKLRSSQVFEKEEAVASLRKLTRTSEHKRIQLCTPRMLSTLRSLIASRYASIQVNTVAALVNLSLEDQNKVKMVRSGIVPPLIDVLKGGFPEAQEHSAGALFSLALNDQNKTAIGVLGALPPLLHALRSESDRTQHDSALALYHLSLVQSNRAKLVKMGSIQTLLGMLKSGHMTGRALLVVCNLAGSTEARAAMLDSGAVECLVGMLSRDEFESDRTRESCVTALYGLSYGGLRFKALAKEAKAEEVLRKLAETGTKAAKEKAKLILDVMRKKDEEEEEVDWEELLNLEDVSQTRY